MNDCILNKYFAELGKAKLKDRKSSFHHCIQLPYFAVFMERKSLVLPPLPIYYFITQSSIE